MSINPEKVEVHFSKKSRNSKNLKNLNRFKISRKKSPFHLSIQILSQKLLIYIYLPISLSQTYLKHSHYLSLLRTIPLSKSDSLPIYLSVPLYITHNWSHPFSIYLCLYLFIFSLFSISSFSYLHKLIFLSLSFSLSLSLSLLYSPSNF